MTPNNLCLLEFTLLCSPFLMYVCVLNLVPSFSLTEYNKIMGYHN